MRRRCEETLFLVYLNYCCVGCRFGHQGCDRWNSVCPGNPGLFSIESTHNYGASFSLFSGSQAAQIIFIVLGIACSAGLVLYNIFAKKVRFNAWFYVGAGLVVGGILGNAIDRIALGYVRDFISLDFVQFAIFNIADAALSVGAICLAVWLLFFAYNKREEGKSGEKGI